MSLKTVSVPKYRHHKGSGQAFVQIKGHRHYLGKWGTPESKTRYSRFVAELAIKPAAFIAPARAAPPDFTVVELAAAYLDFAEGHYQRNGRPTRTVDNISRAIKFAVDFYGREPVADFGPLSLLTIQQKLIATGSSRAYINKQVGEIKRMFKWGVSREFMSPGIYTALSTVEGLRFGRTAARETEPVKPVEATIVNTTLPYLPPVVADMVRVQRLTGCRPGEICQLRPCDVDRSGDVWKYRPASHKTEYRGRDRVIYIGPRAQAVLLPYLLRDANSNCFQPVESEQKRHETMRACRRSRVQPSQLHRRKARPSWAPKNAYTKDSYHRAIQRACETAFDMPKELRRIPSVLTAHEKELPPAEQERILAHHEDLRARAREWRHEHCWHPNQLRHAAATEIRHGFDLEAAQVVLGHARADVTQVYAERDKKLAANVMRQIG